MLTARFSIVRRGRTAGWIVVAVCGGVLSYLTAMPRHAVAKDEQTLSTAREADVAVVLARNCLECHNASDHKGGLDLTQRKPALAGGDSGEVLKLGDPENRLLLKRIDAGEMPPKGRDKLSAADRKLLRDWIKDGAIWATDPINPFLYTSARRAGYNWWSLQPLRIVEPPPATTPTRSVGDGGEARPQNPIDNIIRQRSEKAGLTPLQALSLLNDAFIGHYAGRFAERLRGEAGDDATAQVRRAYALAFARQPAPEEIASGQRFIADHGLAQFCVVLFNASEFLFVD